MSIIFVLIRTIESTAKTIINIIKGPFSKNQDNKSLIYRCPKEYPASFKEWYVDDKHPGFRQRYNRMFCKPKGGYLNKIQSQGVFVLLFRYFAILTMAFCVSYSILIGINDTTPEEGNDVSRLLAYLVMGNVPDDNDVVRYYHWGWYFAIFIFIMIAGVFFMAAITKRFLDENPALVFAPKLFFDPSTSNRAFTVLCQNQDYTSLTDFEYYLGVSLIFNNEEKRQAFFGPDSDNNMCLLSAALQKNAVSIDSMVTIQMKTLPILDADTNNFLDGLFNQLNEDLKYCYICYTIIDFILENNCLSSGSHRDLYTAWMIFHGEKYPNNNLNSVSETDFLRCWVFLIMDKMNPKDKHDGNEKYQNLKKYEDGLKAYIEDFSTNIKTDEKYKKKVEERNAAFNSVYEKLIIQRDKFYKILKNNPRAINYYIDDIKNLTISTVKLLLEWGLTPKYQKYARLLNSIKKKQSKEDKVDYTYNELADCNDLLTIEHKRKFVQLYPTLRIQTSEKSKKGINVRKNKDAENEFLFAEPVNDKSAEPDISKRLRVIIHAKSIATGETFIWQRDYEMKDVLCGIAPIEDPVHWYDADLIDLYNEHFDDLFAPTPRNACAFCMFDNNCPLQKKCSDLKIRPCTDKDWSLINNAEINEEVTKQLDQNVDTLKTFLQSPRLTLGGFYNDKFVGFIMMCIFKDEARITDNDKKTVVEIIINQTKKNVRLSQIAYIELILLKKKYRRRFGLAALMIRAMEKDAIKKGFKFIATMASPENEASIKCFTNAGFISDANKGNNKTLLYKNIEYVIRECLKKDIPAIVAMQATVHKDNLKKNQKQLLIKTNESKLKKYISNPHWTYGVFDENELIGYIVMSRHTDCEGKVIGNVGKKFDFLLDIQGDKDPDEPCKERNQIAYIELIIVQKKYRGLGLSTMLIQAMEKEVRTRSGFKFMATMVSPENEASIKCFTNAGFEAYTVDDKPYIYRTKEGYDRYLLFKRLESDEAAQDHDPEVKQ